MWLTFATSLEAYLGAPAKDDVSLWHYGNYMIAIQNLTHAARGYIFTVMAVLRAD